MSTVLYAKPGIRVEGKKAKWGYLIVTDEKVVHVSPNMIYLKILLVGFVPFLIFGEMIARKHAAEWAANPPENSRAVSFGNGVSIKPGRFRVNSKLLGVATPDGNEYVFGMPYKKAYGLLSPALTGRQVSIAPA
ncbi:MAG TPA: hypothetical protein VME70_07740 [Mycobacteriales bacterium]|nr:hypothetical protein [Mycobacteriales bacterium]